MITIEKLEIRYVSESPILYGLDLTLEFNRIHGLVGLNGSGKTTLLNAIYGLVPINSGDIMISGLPSNKKVISYLQAESYFYSNITGAEYLSIFNNENFATERWNELFKLPLNSIIDTYSSGMKKKLALMGIMKQDKPIIILDEPFNGLDIESTRILRSILLGIKDRKTIIITSHVMETLTNLCDCIHYLEDGKIKYNKEKNQFATFEAELYKSIELKNQETIANLLS